MTRPLLHQESLAISRPQEVVWDSRPHLSSHFPHPVLPCHLPPPPLRRSIPLAHWPTAAIPQFALLLQLAPAQINSLFQVYLHLGHHVAQSDRTGTTFTC